MADLFIREIKTATDKVPDLWFADLWVCDTTLCFKLDTGSEANVIPTRIYNQIQAAPLQPLTCTLITFSGHRITPDGEVILLVAGHSIKLQMVPEC